MPDIFNEKYAQLVGALGMANPNLLGSSPAQVNPGNPTAASGKEFMPALEVLEPEPVFNQSGSINPEGANDLVQAVEPITQEVGSSVSKEEMASAFKGTPFEGFEDLASKLSPMVLQMFKQKGFDPDGFSKNIYEALINQDYLKLQGLMSTLSKYNISMDPTLEKWIDNMIAKQNTKENQSWEEEMRNTSYLSAANQLEQIGLSSSGVLQTGAASHSGVQTARNDFGNNSMEMKKLRYQQRMAMAKQLISMTSQMAAAGIHGGTLGFAKQAAGTIASSAANSGLKWLKIGIG